MSDTPETHAAILRKMRADVADGENAFFIRADWLSLCDRIEAAAEREREINQKILSAANDANAILKDDRDRAIQFANAAPHPGSVSWKEMHEVYAKARAILSAVPKEGNAAALREALNQLRDWALLDINENVIRSDEPNYKKLVDGIVEITNAALAAPARNCDRPECATAEGAISALRANPCANHDFCKEQLDCAECATRWLIAQAKKGGEK